VSRIRACRNHLRKITPDGVVSTYATGGLQDVTGIVGDENGRIYASNWAGGSLFDITESPAQG
jgi:hypothetical protein